MLVREDPDNSIEESEVDTDKIRKMELTEIRETDNRQAVKKTRNPNVSITY